MLRWVLDATHAFNNAHTSAGLGLLTDGLRSFLKIVPKLIIRRVNKEQEKELLLDKESRENRKLLSRRHEINRSHLHRRPVRSVSFYSQSSADHRPK